MDIKVHASLIYGQVQNKSFKMKPAKYRREKNRFRGICREVKTLFFLVDSRCGQRDYERGEREKRGVIESLESSCLKDL